MLLPLNNQFISVGNLNFWTFLLSQKLNYMCNWDKSFVLFWVLFSLSISIFIDLWNIGKKKMVKNPSSRAITSIRNQFTIFFMFTDICLYWTLFAICSSLSKFVKCKNCLAMSKQKKNHCNLRLLGFSGTTLEINWYVG